jgi:hypothetical protein
MENQTELKWHQKPTSIIILLVLFFPVGLYYMWKNNLWSKKTRWIVTGICSLIVIGQFGSKEGGNKTSEFYNQEFTSGTGTAFGMKGYNSIIFKKDGTVEYQNMNKSSNDKNANFHPSGRTTGSWSFTDSTKKKLDVIFLSGVNADKAGEWEFQDAKNEMIKSPSGKIMSRL